MSRRSACAWAIEQASRYGVPATERMLYVVLVDRAASEGCCSPGQHALMADAGLAERAVRQLTGKLVKRGLIRIERQGRTLYYHIVRVNGMDPDPQEHRHSMPVSETPTPAPSAAIDPEIPAPDAAIEDSIPAPDSGIPGQYRKPVPVFSPETASDSRARIPQTLSSFDQEEESKEESPSVSPPPAAPLGKNAAPGGAATRGHQIPATWLPNAYSLSLGYELGLSDADIAQEAAAMRDWAINAGKPGKDWDRRFNNWLREEAKRRRLRVIRNQPKQTLAAAFGLKSFLLDDDDQPYDGRLQ